MTDEPRNNLSYEAAMHGIQTGVAFLMNGYTHETEPKHLRVGVNAAMVEFAALCRLLVAKGIMTRDEFTEELRLEANRELDRYEDRVRKINPAITLR